MTGDLAPGLGARCLVAAPRPCGGDRGGGVPGSPVDPTPLRIPDRAFYSKDDVFGLCDALARAERALIRVGERDEAAQLAAAFDVLESGLA